MMKYGKLKSFLFVSLSITAMFVATSAYAQLLALDNAADVVYDAADSPMTGQNGGFGFDPWTIQTDTTGGGFAGAFIGGGSNIDTSGEVFGTFANGGDGTESVVLYRGFSSNSLNAIGHAFELAMQNASPGSIVGGSGFVLRNGNASASVADLGTGERFRFFAGPGGGNYTYVDAGGANDTGIAISQDGVVVYLTLTDANNFTMNVAAAGGGTLGNFTGALAGAGDIDSVALYNNATGGFADDAFFNSLHIAVIPEPGSMLLLTMTGFAIASRRRRR